MKKLAYVVWVGREKGVFDTWAEAEIQTKGFQGARFKGFSTRAEAEEASNHPWENYIDIKGKTTKAPVAETVVPAQELVLEVAGDENNFGLAPGETPWD